MNSAAMTASIDQLKEGLLDALLELDKARPRIVDNFAKALDFEIDKGTQEVPFDAETFMLLQAFAKLGMGVVAQTKMARDRDKAEDLPGS